MNKAIVQEQLEQATRAGQHKRRLCHIPPTNTGQIALEEVDLLLSTKADKTLTSQNSLTVAKEDVFVFRPAVPGDYSSGWFYTLLQNPLSNGIRSVTLIEQDTPVGDTTLRAGDFLLVAGSATYDTKITLFETADVGASTGGTIGTLLDGADANVLISKHIYGLDLVETTTTLGGTSLDAGTLLLSGTPFTSTDCIWLVPPGDVNCDGHLNNFDIDPFVELLVDPAGYHANHPSCPGEDIADVNGDGAFNMFDIDPFVDLLVNRY